MGSQVDVWAVIVGQEGKYACVGGMQRNKVSKGFPPCVA